MPLRLNSSTFDLQLLSEQTRKQGTALRLWSGRRCTCNLSGDPNRAVLTCKVCGGFGIVYPTTFQMIYGLQIDTAHEYQLRDAGVVLPGDMILSLDPFAPEVKDRDLVRLEPSWMMDPETYAGDVLQRGITSSDRLAYQVARLDRVVQDDPDTGATRTYIEGVDFTISLRQIVWAAGHGPRVGTSYGVFYHMYYPYMVFVPPALKMERGQMLGQRAVIRRIDVVIQMLQNGNGAESALTFDAAFNSQLLLDL